MVYLGIKFYCMYVCTSVEDAHTSAHDSKVSLKDFQTSIPCLPPSLEKTIYYVKHLIQ